MTELKGTILHDPEVKGVERLLDPDGPIRFVRDLREQVPLRGRVTLMVVKQRPGQRAVLRIEEEAGGAPRAWYAKLARRGAFGDPEALANMTRLSEAARTAGVHVPAPVAYLPRFRAVVTPAAGGAACLETPGGAGRRAEIFGRIGEALARLHAVLPRPEEIRTQAFERERFERVVDELADRTADWAEELIDAAARWSQGAPASEDEERERLATIHGDLYPDQVLVEPETGGDAGSAAPAGLTVLDWDSLCAGRAERDVGNFEAHLLLEAARSRLAPGEAGSLRRRFRQGYASTRPLDQDWLAWYLRGSLLRLAALHAHPDFGAHPPNAPELPRALIEASARI